MTDEQSKPFNWKLEVVRWLLGQGPLAVILAFLGYGGWNFANYTIKEGIPSHLQSIQAGYERMEEKHATERAKDQDEFVQALKDLSRRPVGSAPINE